MSAAAQREDSIGSEAAIAAQANGTDGPSSTSALRQLAAERLAAHRHRRAAVAAPAYTSSQIQHHTPGPTTRPSVRDAVAARYRQSPSYQEFLAAEAERALQKAQAEAEVAARNARALADAQRQLLEDIEQWNQPPTPQPLFVVEPPTRSTEPAPPSDFQREPDRRALKGTGFSPSVQQPASTAALAAEGNPPAPLKIQLFADLPAAQFTPTAVLPEPPAFDPNDLEELGQLDGEIAFRLAPEFQEHLVETHPIQANIIEFPRQLVASRKVRPRLAEGPLREDGTPEPQLRIFEVEPEQFSTEPEPLPPTAAPEWQSMLLAPPAPEHGGMTAAQAAFDAEHNVAPAAVQHIYAAPVSRRIMAMAVDAICVGTAFVGFVALAVRLCGPSLHDLPLPVTGAAAALALLVFSALYPVLFFCFNEATPGMTYARLGFCTFADTNPSRRAVRRRLWATAVAVSPLGLGLLWMALDSDRLGWHDRISRIYPRAY